MEDTVISAGIQGGLVNHARVFDDKFAGNERQLRSFMENAISSAGLGYSLLWPTCRSSALRPSCRTLRAIR